ncbi:hypothetical protein QTP88_000912 [Uroleucon formosanum]
MRLRWTRILNVTVGSGGGIVNVSAHQPAQPIVRPSVIQYAPPAIVPQDSIQIAPQIFVPVTPASGSNTSTDISLYDDDICMTVMNEYENEEESYTTGVSGKRVSTANNASAARAKKTRMEMVKSPGFVEILSSASRKIVWYYAKNLNNTAIYSDFLRPLMPELVNLLKTHVQKHAIKFNLKLEATYNRPNVPNSSENRAFKTIAVEIFPDSDIRTIIEIAYMKLTKEKDDYSGRGSGFALESIDGLLVAVYKYMPMGGSSYIELPAYIDRKRGTINPQNMDQECFKWAILTRHVAENLSDKYKYEVGRNYKKHEDKYDFEGISFPTPLSDIRKFEKNNNNVSINVYGLEKKFQIPKMPRYEVYPLRVTEEEKTDHFDLLLVTDGDNSHYVYISDFSRLVRAQKTGHKESVVFCKRCFTSFANRNLKFKLSGQEALNQHKLICGAHKPILPEMPKEGECLEFEAWKKTQRHPIVIYADFETILMKTDEDKGDNTRVIHKHEAMSYGLIVKASENVPIELLAEYEIPAGPVIYRGSESKTDVASHFVETVTELSLKIEELLKTNKPIVFTDEDRQSHVSCNLCNLCKTNFTYDNHKVADHCHISGKYRQALCNVCNLKLQTPKFVPIFFHNLSNYDAHLIVTELGHDTQAINVIPNSEEKYISFSKYVTNTFSMRFIDTFRFMASSLSSLTENLITPEHDNFRETAKHFVTGDMPLVTRKGVYPYEYTDSWERLDEERLPSKREFYSTLTETEINEEDFKHAKLVWDHFDCTTLGEYSDLYLKIDVLLLADVFENFRDVCMRAYNLDAAHYFTAPGLSFDAMLKFTGQKLQLLDEYDMLLMFENGIRGGLVQVSKRYAKANNAKTPGYDETKEKSWIIYQDCNNLYGWAMSQYMPYGGFNWVEPTLNGLDDLDTTSPIGRVYEVDVTYPRHLHDKHNDLPFLPQNSMPHGSKVRKLMATFEEKKNYIIHYRNLQQAIKNGLIVEKVHRVIQFNQSDWLAKYIELNTMMRKKAINDFEMDFYKLMNNAVFGKTMQSKRKEMKMELVSCERRLQKLINKSTFKHCTNYNENLNAVALENKIIKFDKPIYIGFAVLEISKTLMYDYHYNVMQKHYRDKIKLMYTDTDSLIYHVDTEDFYEDLAANSILLDRMDTANLPSAHPCYVSDRKKSPGFFSDEVDGNIVTEFCALRAKSYAFNIYPGEDDRVGGERIKAKGIRAHVVKNHMTLEDHRKCLFGEDGLELYRENVSIRSFNHQLMTIKTKKLTYNSYDDKRVVLEDKINTLAHGHYSIEEDDI